MVNITNGINSFAVSRGAFDGIFSHQGYSLVEEEPSAVIDGPAEDGKVDDTDAFLLEIIEKPISAWSKSELKKFCTIKGIDTSAAATFTDAKEIVKACLEEQA